MCYTRRRKIPGDTGQATGGAILGDGNIMLLAPYFHFLTFQNEHAMLCKK